MEPLYNEPVGELGKKERDIARAIASLKEELDAIDGYNQRAALAVNDDLKKILEHNRDEEIEHAVMVFEWLRRNMDKWDENMKTYLFTSLPVTEIEELGGEDGGTGTSLGVGKPKN